MHKGRLEAFSDGVIAIIITIMVLELRPPHAVTFDALREVLPAFVSYVLSFLYLAIYWNNHHHMLQVCERVSGGVLWANLHLLFWLSLVPFVTAWMGENHFAPAPVAVYGGVLLAASIAYFILARLLVRAHGPDSVIARALGSDRKGLLSTALYLVALPVASVMPWVAGAIYVIVAIIWIIPDPRMEAALVETRRFGDAATP